MQTSFELQQEDAGILIHNKTVSLLYLRFNDSSDYYDMNGFTHFNEDSIFWQPKKKTRRFDKTPSPIKFDLYQEYNPAI